MCMCVCGTQCGGVNSTHGVLSVCCNSALGMVLRMTRRMRPWLPCTITMDTVSALHLNISLGICGWFVAEIRVDIQPIHRPYLFIKFTIAAYIEDQMSPMHSFRD